MATLDTIHDEFGHGLASPHAVKNFLRHVHESWRRSPRFVVLLGKGTIDFRDNWGQGDNLNTPLFAATPLGLYASDNRLADVSGDDGVPEFMIGRIPVLSNEELRNFIDKLQAYEAGGLGEVLPQSSVGGQAITHLRARV